MPAAPKSRTFSRCQAFRAGGVGRNHGTTHTAIDVFVGGRLRELRDARRMAMTEVSRATDIPACHVASYESGELRVPPGDLIELAEFYGVGLQALFPGKPADSAAQTH